MIGSISITGPFVGYAFDLWGMSFTLGLLAVATLVIFAGLIVPLVFAARAQEVEAVSGSGAVVTELADNPGIVRACRAARVHGADRESVG